ncbi:hypothetical protein ACZ87_01192, partial [Candidatus Erwinia dacicola]
DSGLKKLQQRYNDMIFGLLNFLGIPQGHAPPADIADITTRR